VDQLFVEDAMHERDGNGSFADRRRDALDIPTACVADREHARQAGLEQERRAL
jgi:hypothetical protein